MAAVNVTLVAFAADRRAAVLCCGGTVATGCPLLSIDIS